MRIIELREPIPRARENIYRDYGFEITAAMEIPKLRARVLTRLDRVLSTRQSRRAFTAALSLQETGDLLYHSMRVRQFRRCGERIVWESRPAPSGGGCHPIHVVLIGARFAKHRLLVYDAQHHMFGVVQVHNLELLRRCITEVTRCLKIGKGTVFWFLADVARTGAKYYSPESLVWRDSGALLGVIGVVADALGLNCCGFGFHEIHSARKLLNLPQHVIGVGGCVISARARF